MAGGVGITIYLEGFPTGTTPASNWLNVEYIYHIEGTPVVGTIAGQPESDVPAILTGTTALVEAGMALVSGPNALKFIDKATQFLNRAGPVGLKGMLRHR